MIQISIFISYQFARKERERAKQKIKSLISSHPYGQRQELIRMLYLQTFINAFANMNPNKPMPLLARRV